MIKKFFGFLMVLMFVAIAAYAITPPSCIVTLPENPAIGMNYKFCGTNVTISRLK